MLKEICEVMKEAYDRNWITTRDGNCALVEIKEKCIYMTPTGVRKNIIDVEDLVKITSDGEIIFHNESKPSGEWNMHYKILNASTSNTTTLHLHPPYIVAAMHAGWELSDLVSPFPEVYRYTKVGKNVDSHPALSKELAKDTYKNMCANGELFFDIVGQKSHGVCSRGTSPWQAFEHIERVEHVCKIVLLSGVEPKN